MHEHDKTLWCSLDELQMFLGSCKQNGYNFKAEILPSLFVYNRWEPLKKKENRRILLGKKMWGLKICFVMFTCVQVLQWSICKEQNSSIPAVFGCKDNSVRILCIFLNSNIFFITPWKSPFGNMLLSLQEEKYLVVWTWKCKSGSAVISSATDLLLTYFENKFTPLNTHIKKMCGWTFHLH